MNGVLVCAGEAKSKNIGDYIQSVAQEQFFSHTDCFVEREHLNTFKAKEKVNVIMNAWFMWHPENFPPSKIINPYFISFHVVPGIADKLLTAKNIEYFKKYEPIGTRDLGTKDLLEKNGIKCYFSGCLTLTLGLKYKSKDKNDLVYFVDPYYELGNGEKNRIIRLISSVFHLVRHFSSVLNLSKNFVIEEKGALSKISRKLDFYLRCASFYHSYSKAFDDDILFNAIYITHNVDQKLFNGNEAKMNYAKMLIKKYSKAKLVITSRIHCALPCLAIETPVIFVNSNNLNQGKTRSGGRFGGLIELLHTVKWSKSGVDITPLGLHKKKITRDFQLKNKTDYIKIKDSLIENVNNFIKRNE